MEKYVIKGGNVLEGEVSIAGAKNAALGILAAAVMTDEECIIENVPYVEDTKTLLRAIETIGAKVKYIDNHTVSICGGTIRTGEDVCVDDEYIRKIRASYYLLGALLGKYNYAQVALPGGCDIGLRPIDQHIKGFEAMGAMVEQSGGYVCADAPKGGLRGGHIYLDIVSVGATMNILLAAVLCSGMTIIENCAKEPHIVDLANFLNAMGAQISGAGTDVIKVRGVRALHGGSYSIIPDQIEAGTYMAAAAAVGGDVLIENVIPKHLDCITAKLREIGADITEYDDAIRVESAYRLHRANVKTMPYPGFPTDMQPQITVCLATAVGTSLVTEGVYDNRFRYTAELGRMGANIQVEGKTAIIDGVQSLHGCEVRACDLRAGAAMVIAAMCAEGTTLIEDAHFIERGYEDIVGKLTALGASIRRVETFETPSVTEDAG